MKGPSRLVSAAPDFETRFAALLEGGIERDAEVERDVRAIVERVRAEGDAAVLEYTRRFDAWSPGDAGDLAVAQSRLDEARSRLERASRDALHFAAERIREYHRRQCQDSWSYREADGTMLGQRITALDRVGVYVPGGKAAYPSSVLMNVLPAKVAGVGEVVMVVPAARGVLDDLVLAAASVAGVDRVFAVGGAQAVAALAYGTRSIPTVDKIVGPGNAYVAEAKRQVFGAVGIDMIAGPSEIVVVCDGATPAEWTAMDLFSQAEHDEDARAILLSPSAAYLDEVEGEMRRLLTEMPRRGIIAASLAAHGALVEVRDLTEAVELVNRIAPEHLELSVEDPEALLPRIRHAGAVFMGRHTPEVLGDYCAGPNHVLPTAGTARFSSPLGVYDFQKRTSLVSCSPAAACALGDPAATLARGEGLEAHARSAELRREGLEPKTRERRRAKS